MPLFSNVRSRLLTRLLTRIDRLTRLFPAALSAAALTALGLGVAASGSQASELNVYSARHYDSDTALYDAFTAATGVEVNILQGDSDQLIARIQREGAASPADILLTVDVARLWRAEESGVLAPVQSETLARRIPEHLRHPDGLWFGFSTRARLIFYKPGAVDPATIATYESLADPVHRGRICIRSSTNPYNQSLIASMIAAHGAAATETWAKGIVANLARAPQGGDTDQLKALAAGECDIAVANHYYYLRMTISADPAERAMAEQIAVHERHRSLRNPRRRRAAHRRQPAGQPAVERRAPGSARRRQPERWPTTPSRPSSSPARGVLSLPAPTSPSSAPRRARDPACTRY
jgi:iron(III) transport system substrate-binding protein